MGNNPLAAYHFIVEWGGTKLGFSEVSGLNIEHEVIEYREGSSPEFKSRKIPGMVKYSNITLKRGIMKSDTEFMDWMNTINMNAVERRDIIISLLNEVHEPVMSWKAKNAWPTKYSGPILNATGSDIAIETLELAHEGLSIVK
ncbi:MAG: phage tail protein [Ginsengibacter sp.]